MEHIESGAKVQPSNLSGQSKEHVSSALPLQSSTAKQSSHEQALLKWLLRGLALVAVGTVSTTVGLATALMIPVPTGTLPKNSQSLNSLWQTGFQYQVGRPVNILVMGIDRVPGAKVGSPEMFSGRSDTMLLLRADPETDSVSLLSIPRDTQVEIPEVGVTKINDANVRGGASLAATTVSSALNGVQIDRYVRVSTDAFRELVDLLGGVEVYVPAPMSYVDQTQKLTINLSAGLQRLNGDQAEQFARFRQDAYGDIGRVQRQQVLLKALLKRLTSPMMLPRIPSLLTSMQKYIDTNLSVEEMLALVGAGRKLSQGNFKMVMLPGRFSAPDEFVASYWILNPEGRDRVMRQYFKIDSVGTEIESARAPNSLRIAIQNASTQADAADQLRRYLVDQGFGNVYVASDWSDHQRQTQIIAQQGDLSSAESLKNVLRLGRVEADSTGDLESDLTIRVGDDWVSQLNKSAPNSQ